MIPGVNPRQMQQMMRKMGIQQKEIAATEVIIKTEDKEIVITNPSVARVNMMGQDTFQISGEVHERELSTAPDINEDDIKTVMAQANVNRESALKAIEESEGDLADAIMKLAEKED
ncbi:MAG: nascent polypeptide-associated complex protein [archaeon]|nr:nascent polypeptide-associated complex protein [Nanoarchaeota archaeon]